MRNMVPLGDLVDIKGGGTPDKKVAAFWDGDIPWASVKDFKNGVLDRTVDRITIEGVAASATQVIPAGHIIVPTRMAVGKAAINTIDLAINQDLKALFPKTDIDTRYLYHALLANSEKLMEQATGATVKGIKLDVLKNLKIPLPPLEEQRRIAGILDQAAELCRLRTRALEKLNTLGQAIFHEMFGEIMGSAKLRKLGDLCSKIGSGATPRGGDAAYKKAGVPLIRSMNVRDGRFDRKGLAFLDDTQADGLRNVIVHGRDVLLNITGASVARVSLAPEDLSGARVNQHVAIIRPIIQELVPEFLEAFLLLPRSKFALMQIAEAGATRQAITKTQIEEFEVPLFPLEQQMKFLKLRNQIAEQSVQAQMQEMSCNALFASLQHRAFRGDL